MNPVRKITLGAAALVASAGGVGLATIGSANATSSTTPSSTQASAQASAGLATVTIPVDPAAPVATDSPSPTAADTDAATDAAKPRGPHTANGITEAVLTGSDATSVEAAVTAKYPDATIERMETDAEGAAFEAHVTKADGSDVTVKLDASFTITGEVTGHG